MNEKIKVQLENREYDNVNSNQSTKMISQKKIIVFMFIFEGPARGYLGQYINSQLIWLVTNHLRNQSAHNDSNKRLMGRGSA